MFKGAMINRFEPHQVMAQVMGDPSPPVKWKVEDFHNKKLCALVVEAFGKANMSPADFEEAIHFAREHVYQDSKTALKQVIGLPYCQWMSMQLACKLLEIPGFCFGEPCPSWIEAPADLAYTTLYLKKVKNFGFRGLSSRLEGLNLERWGLYDARGVAQSGAGEAAVQQRAATQEPAEVAVASPPIITGPEEPLFLPPLRPQRDVQKSRWAPGRQL
ncbi:hypothetical protein NLG97_g537 [Lecanicillium saksenae]|uniref:Uncharacterized protein n=1 Tax=Lecanicillium saksenae TaxID=468837 RepID=A0ACC1R6G9_9HYPO|nr:hypothetical protein NLG97_g537 [Lecanicillium saksenae]